MEGHRKCSDKMTTNPLEQKIEQICLDIIEAKKWRPFRDIQVKVPEEPLPNPIMAYIDLPIRRINIFVDGNIEQLIKEVIQKEKLALDVPAYLEALMYFSVVHEYGHHRYCPRTNEYMKSILTGIYEAIQGREFKEERIEGLCLGIHNMFSDSVLNAINSHTDDRKELFQSGFNLFYLVSGYADQKKKHKKNKAMTLFLRSNQALSQTPPELNERILRYQHRWFMSLPRYTKKVLDVFTGDKELTRSLIIGNASKEETDYLTGRLNETALWKQMSYDYAQIIYPFLRQPPAGLDNSFTRSNEPNSSGEGSESGEKCEKCEGKQGKLNKNQSSGQGQGKKPAGKSQNPQDNQNDQGNQDNQSGQDGQSNNHNQDQSGSQKNAPGKDKKEQSLSKEEDNNSNSQNQPGKKKSETDKNDDLRKEKEGKSRGKELDNDTPLEYTPGKSNPIQGNPKEDTLIKLLKKMLVSKTQPFSSPYLNQFGLLDRLYTSRAGKIKLFAEEYREGAHYELPLSRSEMPLDEFSSKQVDWSSTRIITQNDGKKEVMLYRRDTPIILPFESEYSQGGLPDLSFIFDSSYSMHFDPFTNEGKGDYHLAALTVYSILNGLEDMGVAPLLNYHLINFSNITSSSGWCPYAQLSQFKRTLFDYQGGGTSLDPLALRNLRLNRRDNAICFMLSDTGFHFEDNAREVLTEIEAMIKSGAFGFYLFQIGDANQFSEAVKEIGGSVQEIHQVDDFMEASIRFTKDLYGEAIRT